MITYNLVKMEDIPNHIVDLPKITNIKLIPNTTSSFKIQNSFCVFGYAALDELAKQLYFIN